MDNVTNSPPAPADTSVSAATAPPDPGSPAAASRARFNLAFDSAGEPGEPQSPKTRQAVMATLDGLQHMPDPAQPEASRPHATPTGERATTPPGPQRQTNHGLPVESSPESSRPGQPIPGGESRTGASDNRNPADTAGPDSQQNSSRPTTSNGPGPAQPPPPSQSSTRVAENPDSAADNSEPAQSTGTEAPRRPVTRPAGFAQQVSEVVDRILVSLPNSSSKDEVRIQLKPSILDGSEIRIFRNAGEINIVFIPKSEAARAFLTVQESRFQAFLADRMRDERVRVEVAPAYRGQTPYDENEGRSRQRYSPQDDEWFP